jgi:hypothetical protein
MEMFEDKMVRVFVALLVKRSQITPFYLRLNNGENYSDSIRKEIESNFEGLEKLINQDLKEMVIESQFLGDSYSAIIAEEGVGVTNLIHNFSTKAVNVTPIISNKNREVAFEIAQDGTGLFELPKLSRPNRTGERLYIEPHFVSRINAKSTGIREPTMSSLLNVRNMNAWDEEKAYEDLVYGGMVEGCIESYRRFKWALNALSNARTGSAYLERFIMLHLQDTSKSERTLLREALKTNLDTVRKKVNQKQTTEDPSVSVYNYVIPTTGSAAKGSIDIQESAPSLDALKSIEDINIHIKKFMADLGFNINLTPFGETQDGGLEDGGFSQKSLIMESQAEDIRASVAEYITKVVRVHFLYKYHVVLQDIGVEYTGIIELAKQQDEINRQEALNNSSNFWAFISDLKEQNFKDTPANRNLLHDQIKPKMEANTRDKLESLKSIVDHVLTPPEIPEEEGE